MFFFAGEDFSLVSLACRAKQQRARVAKVTKASLFILVLDCAVVDCAFSNDLPQYLYNFLLFSGFVILRVILITFGR